MGEEQRAIFFDYNKDPTSSSTISDLAYSSRPKIYAIVQMLKQRYVKMVAIAQEHYHMDYATLSAKDQVTLQIIENYLALKVGEIWLEVAHELHLSGIIPIGMDTENFMVVWKRQQQWAMQIETQQNNILMEKNKKDCKEEEEFYKMLRENRLASSLNALQKMEYIARTTNRQIQQESKNFQRNMINSTLFFPSDENILYTHRSYQEGMRATVMLQQSLHIQSVKEESLAGT